MTVTFIRHGQSYGNLSDTIDTTVPGPELTDKGRKQATAVAAAWASAGFDCIFASDMTRTQQTAAPLAKVLDEKVVVLPGVGELQAGIYQGTLKAEKIKDYLVAPTKWLDGDLDARIPGAEDGNEFDKRMDDALATIAADGCTKPAIFSHSATITYWTILNTDAGKGRVATGVNNTGYVIIKGSPAAGWKLVKWSANPAS